MDNKSEIGRNVQAKNQIVERFKSRINVVYNIPSFTKKQEDEIYTFIDEIVDIYNKHKKTMLKSNDNKYHEKIISILRFIMMRLDQNVNKYTEEYLKNEIGRAHV